MSSSESDLESRVTTIERDVVTLNSKMIGLCESIAMSRRQSYDNNVQSAACQAQCNNSKISMYLEVYGATTIYITGVYLLIYLVKQLF